MPTCAHGTHREMDPGHIVRQKRPGMRSKEVKWEVSGKWDIISILLNSDVLSLFSDTTIQHARIQGANLILGWEKIFTARR